MDAAEVIAHRPTIGEQDGGAAGLDREHPRTDAARVRHELADDGIEGARPARDFVGERPGLLQLARAGVADREELLGHQKHSFLFERQNDPSPQSSGKSMYL